MLVKFKHKLKTTKLGYLQRQRRNVYCKKIRSRISRKKYQQISRKKAARQLTIMKI